MHVSAINRAQGLAITDDGQLCSVSNWIDCDGDETDDPIMATVAVVPLPNGKWEAVDLRDFQETEAH